MPTGYEILLKGLETVTNQGRFIERSRSVIDAAFEAVFEQAADGKINWRRTARGLTGQEEVVGKATVKTANNTWHEITVLLSCSPIREGFAIELHLAVDGPTLTGYYPDGPSAEEPREEQLASLYYAVFTK